MITAPRDRSRQLNLTVALIATSVLALAFLLGQRASPLWLGLIVALMLTALLLRNPALGLSLAVLVALLVRLEVGTGSEVRLTAVALYIPFLAVVWLLDMVRRGALRVVASRANLPLALFLVAGLLSLLIGRATWDPMVPTKSNFLLVQLAQWAIFALSALAFWLTANLVKDAAALRRLTWVFLGVGGALALAIVIFGASRVTAGVSTVAPIRAPFWVLLTGLAAGQLFFNPHLSRPQRAYLVILLLAILYYAFILSRISLSNWTGIVAVIGVLAWLRFPRLRWALVALVAVLSLLGVLFPTLYDFAGGDIEWEQSGGSRLALIERVVEVTLRNPITGLGPAAYRPYTSMKPLPYRNAVWQVPMVNSHNNYVDLFSHVGLLGLGIFLWFSGAVIWEGVGLRSRFKSGFEAGFANGMTATWVGALVIMLLADWMLPFVYNIGFEGFPASALVWLFLGGLAALHGQANEAFKDA